MQVAHVYLYVTHLLDIKDPELGDRAQGSSSMMHVVKLAQHWALLSFISGPYSALNSIEWLSWAQSLQLRDYIFLDLGGEKNYCPQYMRV